MDDSLSFATPDPCLNPCQKHWLLGYILTTWILGPPGDRLPESPEKTSAGATTTTTTTTTTTSRDPPGPLPTTQSKLADTCVWDVCSRTGQFSVGALAFQDMVVWSVDTDERMV